MKPIEKLIYGIIIASTDSDKCCKLTNKEISDVVGVEPKQISRYISNWVSKKFIVRELDRNERDEITERRIKIWEDNSVFDAVSDNKIQEDTIRPIPLQGGTPLEGEVYIYNNNINHITSNNINNKLVTSNQLTSNDIWEISKKYRVDYDDVKDTYESVMLSVDGGNKYKIKNIKLATIQWLKRAMRMGQIEVLDDMGMQIQAIYHDPDIVEERRLAREQMKKEGFI